MHKKFKEKIALDILELNITEAYKIIGESIQITEIIKKYCDQNLDNKHLCRLSSIISSLHRNLEVAGYRLHKIIYPENDEILNMPVFFKDCEFVFDDE